MAQASQTVALCSTPGFPATSFRRLDWSAAVSTMDPTIVHFYEPDVVAFQVVDSLEGNSARGDYAGHMPGVVRPLLKWTTRYNPSGEPAEMHTEERAL